MSNMSEEDSRDMNKMVLAAKFGKWSEVYGILDSKPKLINCIPEARSWAALHQAVWWNDQTAVKKLLYSYNSCDSLVHTKQDLEGHGAGKTPEDIAAMMGQRSDVKKILHDFTLHRRQQRFAGDIPTYITASAGEEMNKDGLPLLLLALAAHKDSFHPDTIGPNESFHQVMQEIAAFEHQGSHWKHAEEKIASAMDAFDITKGSFLRNAASEDKFYKTIVILYTQNGEIYSYVNKALRQEAKAGYKPEGDDLAVAPYALMLDIVLVYWKTLQKYTSVTYRGVGMSRSDSTTKYARGTKFIWLNFVSSSALEAVAKGFGRGGAVNGHYALFTISNSSSSLWRPSYVADYSAFPHEKEALYPAGAEFEVISIAGTAENDGGYTFTRIHLKLIN